MTAASPRRLVLIAAILTSTTGPVLAVNLEGPSINQAYGAFTGELSAAVKPKGQLLTAASSKGYGGKKVPDSVVEHLDFVTVMVTTAAIKDNQDKPRVDDKGKFLKGAVVGLHVMRREKGFGKAYGENQTSEWEYVEYRADGTYLTPPNKSHACAECHVKAGRDRDFVYRGRLPEMATK